MLGYEDVYWTQLTLIGEQWRAFLSNGDEQLSDCKLFTQKIFKHTRQCTQYVRVTIVSKVLHILSVCL